MGTGLNIVLVIVVIIGITTVVQHGTEGISNNPVQSTWDSTKNIGEKTKDIYDGSREIIDNFKNQNINGTLVGVCQEDNDCLVFDDCLNEICFCIAEQCYKEV